MEAEDAFEEAVKGAAAVAHVATPVMQSFDPNEAVPMVVQGTLNALKAAAKESSVTRVVLTSSSTAAASPQPNKKFLIDDKTWNEDAVRHAWAPPPYEGMQRKLDVYSASKTQAEQEAWKWMRANKPRFVLNTVLPNCNMGRVLSVADQGSPSTIAWLKALWNGFDGAEDIKDNPPQYYINVQDNARVHVAALVYKDVESERLFTFAHPYNWNDILAVFRKLYPDRSFIDDIPDLGHDLSTVANKRAEELLKRFNLTAWTSLETSVQEAADGWA
jgi:nucleoside-diphosphate-sugar epimerase